MTRVINILHIILKLFLHFDTKVQKQRGNKTQRLEAYLNTPFKCLLQYLQFWLLSTLPDPFLLLRF